MSTFLAQSRVENGLSPVRLVSNANVSGAYSNGDGGVGASKAVGGTSLTIDSVAAADGDRVLLNAQTAALENGIYVVSGVGSSVVLTRADDFQSVEQMKPGQYASVEAGTEFAGSIFGVVEPQPAVVGTSSISFANAAAGASSVTLDNDGLNIYNPAGTFLNHVLFTSAITADRNFSIVTGDAARTLTFTGNATLNQDVSTAASPSFVDVDAGSSGSAGLFRSWPETAANGELRLAAVNNSGGDFDTVISNAASVGQNQTISIPDSGQATSEFVIADSAGTQNITSGNLQVDAGLLASGLAAGGFVGRIDAYPTTAANGRLSLLAANNAGGDFDTAISPASSVGQDQVISIPDSGAATANFLLDAGANNLLAKQEFLGLSQVLTFGTGTWTVTRIAQGNYVSRHTPGDETSIVAVDITPAIRAAASKGFRLDSFDYVYAIDANALDAHSAVLDRIEYANNVAVSVNSVAITGTAATATQANPYVTNFSVDAPAFDITADSKYVLELTVNHAAASEYDFYGIMLRFSETIG